MNQLDLIRTESAVAKLKDLFENLKSDDIFRFGNYYHANASFRDPFNDVIGIEHIKQIFKHMFEQVECPKFIITRAIIHEGEAMLFWDFKFNLTIFWQKKSRCIQGVSHVCFDETGLVKMHRDYWDAAEELYSHLPIIGSWMRALQRLMSA